MLTSDQIVAQDDALKNQAFSELPQTLFPLSGDQIKSLRREFNSTQRASSFTQDVPSRPTSTSIASSTLLRDMP